MLLSSQKLIGLPVITQAGDRLGQVISFNLETDSQTVFKYYVANSGFFNKLVSHKQFIIHYNQVISLSQEKMVVENAVVKEKIENKAVPEVRQAKEAEAVLSAERK